MADFCLSESELLLSVLLLRIFNTTEWPFILLLLESYNLPDLFLASVWLCRENDLEKISSLRKNQAVDDDFLNIFINSRKMKTVPIINYDRFPTLANVFQMRKNNEFSQFF